MVKQQIDQARETVRRSIETAGTAARATAALDAGSLAETAFKTIPIFGDTLGEATRQARGFVDALEQTARRLAPFSGELAAAEALAETNRTLGDMRRAQRLGQELSQFTEARSRLSEAGEDATATLLRPIIPIATRVLTALAFTVELIDQACRKFLRVPDAAPPGVDLLDEIIAAARFPVRPGADPVPPPAVPPRAPLGGL
jgi:hypothetical protein